jgi:hypothetical protein
MTDEVTEVVQALEAVIVADVVAPVEAVASEVVDEVVAAVKSAREELIDYANTLGELSRSTILGLIDKL